MLQFLGTLNQRMDKRLYNRFDDLTKIEKLLGKNTVVSLVAVF